MNGNGRELCISGPGLIELIQDVLGKGFPFRFRAAGFSMSPIIGDGDILTISPLSRAPSLGQVVAFIQPKIERLVIHRIVGKTALSYLLMGDNGYSVDGFVLRQNILGYVSRVEREGKELSFGLGPERFAIAFVISHRKLFFPFRFMLGRLMHSLIRRWAS